MTLFSCTIKSRCPDGWSLVYEQLPPESQPWSVQLVSQLHTEALARGTTLAELLALSDSIAASSSQTFNHPVSNYPDLAKTTSLESETVTVNTDFDPSDSRNHTPLKNLSKQERQNLTDKHREWAENAKEPVNLQDLANTVSLLRLSFNVWTLF